MHRSSLRVLTLSGVAFLTTAAQTQAGVIVNGVGSWPTSPALEAIDNFQDDAALDVKDNRRHTQTFQLTTPVTLDKAYIDTTGIVSNKSFTIDIFAVADTNAGTAGSPPPAPATPLLSVTGNTGSLSGASILEFDFTGSDEITLPASVGTAGYAIQINRTQSDLAFKWRYNLAGSTDADLYTAGQGYATAFTPETTHANDDFTLALVAVPEPASLALLGLGTLMLLPRRRA